MLNVCTAVRIQSALSVMQHSIFKNLLHTLIAKPGLGNRTSTIFMYTPFGKNGKISDRGKVTDFVTMHA